MRHLNLRRRAWTAAWILLAPAGALAQTAFQPYVGGEYEYATNLFSVTDANALTTPDGLRQLDDSVQRYKGGFNSRYDISSQSLFLDAEAREYRYGAFTDFNHSEYSGTGGLNWRLGSDLRGDLTYNRSRTMPIYMDSVVDPRAINLQEITTLDAKWQATSNVEVDATADQRHLHAPVYPAYPDFGLDEKSYTATLMRRTGRRLSVGLTGVYRSGEYVNGNQSAPYIDRNGTLDLNYSVTPRSFLHGTLGRSARTILDSGSRLTATTGSIDFSLPVGGKTALGVGWRRAIDSYATSGGASVDDAWNAALVWKPTGKSRLKASYTWASANYSNALLSSQQYDGRKDHLSTARGEWVLQSRTWLSFHLYGQHQQRDSNFSNFAFTGNSYGLSFQIGGQMSDDSF